MTCCLLLFFQAEDGIRDLTVTGVQTCALPISSISRATSRRASRSNKRLGHTGGGGRTERTELFACLHGLRDALALEDRKSTRLNSSHSQISYAVFCLKKKKLAFFIIIAHPYSN